MQHSVALYFIENVFIILVHISSSTQELEQH